MCISQSDWSIKIGSSFYLFITGKNEVPRIREIIYHHIIYKLLSQHNGGSTSLYRCLFNLDCRIVTNGVLYSWENMVKTPFTLFRIRSWWSQCHIYGYPYLQCNYYGFYLIMNHPIIPFHYLFVLFVSCFYLFIYFSLCEFFKNKLINTW